MLLKLQLSKNFGGNYKTIWFVILTADIDGSRLVRW